MCQHGAVIPRRSVQLAVFLAAFALGFPPGLHAGDAGFAVVLFDVGDTLITRPRGWVPGAQEGLAALRDAGARVGLLSNTGNLTRGQLRARFLPWSFRFGDFEEDLVNLSSERGVAKPDPEAFRAAAARAGVPPGRVVFLDEDAAIVAAARAAGLQAIQVNPVKDPAGRVIESDVGGIARDLAARLQASASGSSLAPGSDAASRASSRRRAP